MINPTNTYDQLFHFWNICPGTEGESALEHVLEAGGFFMPPEETARFAWMFISPGTSTHLAGTMNWRVIMPIHNIVRIVMIVTAKIVLLALLGFLMDRWIKWEILGHGGGEGKNDLDAEVVHWQTSLLIK